MYILQWIALNEGSENWNEKFEIFILYSNVGFTMLDDIIWIITVILQGLKIFWRENFSHTLHWIYHDLKMKFINSRTKIKILWSSLNYMHDFKVIKYILKILLKVHNLKVLFITVWKFHGNHASVIIYYPPHFRAHFIKYFFKHLKLRKK
jgi:hypothetical protein